MLKEIDAQSHSILMSDVKLEDKAHPWRRCAHGEHFVHEHRKHVTPTEENPEGTVIVHAHCAQNPSGKEELSHDEIQYITEKYFHTLTGAPTAGVLRDFRNADAYDKEIRGWTQYWNDVLKPDEPLDPNLVKALIATESSFNPNPPGMGAARGLMQIMPNTRMYLQKINGDLKDYYVVVSSEELLDPSTNICAGVRWLFRKKIIAGSKLGRRADWIEAIADYKGLLDYIIKNETHNEKIMESLVNYYNALSWKS